MLLKPSPVTFKFWKYDVPAGIVVFLVAIPLCVGIAVACGVSPMAGLLAGIIGGTVVVFFSDAPYAVSGPAAGLIGIVLMGIEQLGTFNAFLVATFLGGLLQLLMGLLRAGSLAYFIPSSVIKGMLAFIGISLIIKQLPHALGYDIDKFEWQFQVSGHKNIFYVVYESFQYIEPGALLITVLGFFLLYFWQSKVYPKYPYLPAALIVVIFGMLLNEVVYKHFYPAWFLGETHLVNVPRVNSLQDYLTPPDWTSLANYKTWIVGLTVGVIASLETLLTLEAMDKLDPQKRITDMDRELVGQGIGNTLAGLIGALPLTVVIVRSTTSLSTGAKTKLATLVHGILLGLFVFFFPEILNKIPLAVLAVILISVGLKLSAPKIFKTEWKLGIYRFVPFVITILASLFTDLLRGILIGLFVGGFFILYEHYRMAIRKKLEGDTLKLTFIGNVSFLAKPTLVRTLRNIPSEVKKVIIEVQGVEFIDYDILEILYEFKVRGEQRGLEVKCMGIDFSAFGDKEKAEVCKT